jgi:hypothetical protein
MAKKAVILALCLFASSAEIRGQSLADAAKKEQERREKAKQAGAASKPLTEEDLQTTKGKIANDPTKGSVGTAAPLVPYQGDTRSSATEDLGKKEAFWRSRYAAAKARLNDAEKRRSASQMAIHAGQPLMTDATGRRVAYTNGQLKQIADAADAELAAARQAMDTLMGEAGRAGALPGWFR